jgi:hypothetical protein
LQRARTYDAALAEAGASYRTVAQLFQVTREEVCQYVALIRRLPPDVIARVDEEREPSRCRLLSLRRLLAIARLSDDETKRRCFAALMPTLDDPSRA